MRLRALLPLLPSVVALAAAAPADDGARYARIDRAIADTKSAMMGEPSQALRSAETALALAKSLPDSSRARIAVATAQWLDGEAHLFLHQGAEAAPLIATALATAQREAPGTKLEGDLMRSKGAVAEDAGRMQEALAAYQSAYAIFSNAHEDRSRAMTLQDIGRIYRSAGDLERTLRYYQQSAEIYSQDPVLLLTNHNSRGELLWELGRYREAEENYRVALESARKLGSDTLQVRVLTNIAEVQIAQRKLEAADASIRQGLALAHGEGAAEWRPFLLGEAANLAHARGDDATAARMLDAAFQGVDLANSDMEFREFHHLAAQVYERTGQTQLALAHLKAYQRLDAKSRSLTASYGAQLASARFDFANQNARISTLKAQKLAQEVRLEHQQARVRTIIAGALLAIGLGVLGFLSFALITGRRSRDRLRRVNSELARALKAKTEFLAMTSHEIRTPLNGILGMTQVMLAEPKLDHGVRDRLRLVHGAGETMKALVDDILDVAKMETETIAIVEEDGDLGQVLDDLTALWADQARAKGVSLTCDRAAVPARLRFDAARLRQIVFNLLSNAVKFTEAGQIAVRAREEGDGDDAQLVITVRDTGIGIDPAHHQLIFEPFQQADASTTRKFGGTGLGLSICRKLAQAMGGEVTVESRLGEGAIFTLRLPSKRAATEVRDSFAQHVPAATLADARVVLLEANMVTQGLLGGLIEPHVASIVPVATAPEAIELIEKGCVDHLLMEAGSGGESLGALIAAAAAKGVWSTIMVSAAGPVPIEQIAALGADQIVLKPVGGRALLSRLHECYGQPAAAAA